MPIQQRTLSQDSFGARWEDGSRRPSAGGDGGRIECGCHEAQEEIGGALDADLPGGGRVQASPVAESSGGIAAVDDDDDDGEALLAEPKTYG